ncbi:MAG: hypothetical protein NW216_03085 [Hyphomicrobium sp.]|nr:hypothetical protein [Hyphomicrobium sp.]
MRKLFIILSSAAALVNGDVAARAADSWGLQNETVTEIEAKVVDIACSLKGDCPANCGDGRRQLGLLTTDGKLRLAAKGATNFAGAAEELLPYCGRKVFADGLLIENPAMTIFMVQNLRSAKSEPLKPANAFEANWKAKNGDAKEWYREDPSVKKIIGQVGVLGIKGLAPKP